MPFDERVLAVVLGYNGKHWLEKCVPSLLTQCKVLVVDNGSHDDTADYVRAAFPAAEVVRYDPGLGLGAAYNRAIATVREPYVAIVNQDTVIDDGCIARLVAVLEGDAGIGIAAPLVLNPDRSVQDRGSVLDAFGFPIPVTPPAAASTWEPLFASLCLAVIPTAWYRELGGFADYLDFFVEDVDLCWRTWQRGRRVVVDAAATMVHFGGGSIPGGWMRSAVSTSNIRTFYRERNTLAVHLQDLDGWSLLRFVPRYVANSAFEALGLTLSGRRDGAWRYVMAYRSLWSLLPTILAARKRVQRERLVGDRGLRRFFSWRHRKLELVMKHGLPTFEPPAR